MKIRAIPFELIIWITALVLLAVMPVQDNHFTLCPLKNLGFKWCPGCGLGHAIASLLHGRIIVSFHQHWFGVPALLILGHRIFILSNKSLQFKSNI